MSKFSVKKPYTVLVMMLVVMMLGVVSMTKMQMDLLPPISLPYVMVITTYPGASPEKIEATVSEPLEMALGTVTGVENVYSVSNENYSMVQLEFADGTDMESVLVKVSTALDSVKDMLPEECGAPSIMELSVDMLATQYLAVAYDGKNMEELSRFVEAEVIPELERQNGVASVTTMGLIDQTIHVQLNPEKVDHLNDQILGIANDAFTEAMEDMEEARQQLLDSQEELANGRQELLNALAELEDGKQDLIDAQNQLDSNRQELIDGEEELESSRQEILDGQEELQTARTELEEGRETLENSRRETFEQLAKVSQLLEGLETYRAQLTYLQAQDRALDAAVGMIQGSGDPAAMLTGLTNGIAQMERAIATVQDAVDNPTDTTKEATANAVIQNLNSMPGLEALDENELRASLAALQAYKGQLEAQKTQLESAQQLLADYQTQKNNLAMEIQVTQGLITGYENNLRQMGIDYTDIEAAKMEAAAGFAAAEIQLNQGESQIDIAEEQLEQALDQLDDARTQMDAGWDALADGQQQLNASWDSLADGEIQINNSLEQLADGEEQLEEGWESYYDGLVQFEKQRNEALRSANADQLLSLSTLSNLIYAQNFEMPAGYLDDAQDNSWLLKVGNNYSSIEDLEQMVLCYMEDIGDVHLCDVADITIIDNADTTYTKLNQNDAVILSIFKSSTAGTNEVSRISRKTIEELQNKYEGLEILVMMDQGDYINLIVDSVVKNMALGAALAILILAIFLKDFMPTVVVAISIPLSVLTALVAMYFSGISLNMMSLSGMALGIGMLVDNSIVVMENIYRLRSRGVSAPRAAVQGTRQVAAAVVSSTLTTVCVFFPIVFTEGMTRELLLPMALTIIYCLLASLVIAMTVVPASSSTLLRRTKEKKHPLFEKLQNAYGKALGFCLRIKVVPLAVSIGLLVLSIYLVFKMGIVMIPEMTSNQVQATVNFEEEMERPAAYEQMDILLERTAAIDGIKSVGVMAGGGNSLVVSTGEEEGYHNFSLMIITENPDAGAEEVNQICEDLQLAAQDLQLELTVSTGMSEMSSMLGSGVSVSVYGNDLETLRQSSEEIMAILEQVEGFEEISNAQEDADPVLHLNIDKNLAMSKGLTVAQIFQDLSSTLTTSKDSITVTIDGVEMQVEIASALEPLTRENIMDYTFAVKEKDEDGDEVTVDIPLSEIATLEQQPGLVSIERKNQTRYMVVSASVAEGYNATLLARELQPLLEAYEPPAGVTIDLGGESESVNEMLEQMGLMILMGVCFIYFVMVAQFQSLLSPFIVLFTLPLAFTGGLMALWFAKEQVSVMAMMGLVVLLGTVVNNGIVFVDYTNQLRIGGMSRRDALIATGKTRMRPILMTAMTTILAESSMIFGDDMGSQMGKGMALVIAGGLAYATLMTLFIIPVMYDILFKKAPLSVDTGNEDLDDIPDDAQEFMEQMKLEAAKPQKKKRGFRKKRRAEELEEIEVVDESLEQNENAAEHVEEEEGTGL